LPKLPISAINELRDEILRDLDEEEKMLISFMNKLNK